MKRRGTILTAMLGLLVLTTAVLGGCVPKEPEEQKETVNMDITVAYSPYVEEELDHMLSSEKDLPLRKALVEYIDPIFFPTVHDIDFSFYDQRKGGIRTGHLADVLDTDTKRLSLELVSSDYRYGIAANMSANPTVSLGGEETEKELSFIQESGTTEPHRAAMFSSRGRLYVPKDQVTDASRTLFMNNAAAALILNRDSCEVKGIQATYEGLADSFSIVDSTYSFDRKTVIKTDQLDVTRYMGDDQDLPMDASPWGYDLSWAKWSRTPLMVCGAGFPSRPLGTSVVNGNVIIWTINLFVNLADGTTTRNDIYIGQPLQAGHLKIIKGWLQGDGSFSPTPPIPPQGGGGGFNPPTPPQPDDSTTVVGVAVMLNWQEGGTFNPNL